ncbi:hypothetical protein LTR56_019757 [Elasticomyces elasticus]|nr:hypothetical protein LTR56_019757 [Elasticomyces elasticus]KAK3642553.1 hypothetical protein LTR22_015991 [Elasticomyces elasticus]KAK4911310.1 hypothetical protein LTR49_020130 [Elasticomyces elasticus]KAK5738754.1 hypothetical protein LTS12_025482 [Elasticomyces elasticus]
MATRDRQGRVVPPNPNTSTNTYSSRLTCNMTELSDDELLLPSDSHLSPEPRLSDTPNTSSKLIVRVYENHFSVCQTQVGKRIWTRGVPLVTKGGETTRLLHYVWNTDSRLLTFMERKHMSDARPDPGFVDFIDQAQPAGGTWEQGGARVVTKNNALIRCTIEELLAGNEQLGLRIWNSFACDDLRDADKTELADALQSLRDLWNWTDKSSPSLARIHGSIKSKSDGIIGGNVKHEHRRALPIPNLRVALPTEDLRRKSYNLDPAGGLERNGNVDPGIPPNLLVAIMKEESLISKPGQVRNRSNVQVDIEDDVGVTSGMVPSSEFSALSPDPSQMSSGVLSAVEWNASTGPQSQAGIGPLHHTTAPAQQTLKRQTGITAPSTSNSDDGVVIISPAAYQTAKARQDAKPILGCASGERAHNKVKSKENEKGHIRLARETPASEAGSATFDEQIARDKARKRARLELDEQEAEATLKLIHVKRQKMRLDDGE